MKTIILVLLIFFASCGSTNIKQVHDLKSDTAITLVLHLDENMTARVDHVYRIIRDTFSFDTINAETAKRIWKKDTLYYVPVTIQMRDSLGGFIKDSSGNVKTRVQFQLLRYNKFILQDYNKRL